MNKQLIIKFDGSLASGKNLNKNFISHPTALAEGDRQNSNV